MNNDSFIEKVVHTKLKFYDRYAKINRLAYLFFQTSIVLLAAITPILAAMENNNFLPTDLNNTNLKLTYTLISSSILAILEGVSRLFRFKNLWHRYRDTSNKISNELRKFTNSIAEYESNKSLSLFKSKFESIIQEEQNNWSYSMRN